MDSYRFLLFGALVFILMLLFQAWEADQRARQPEPPAASAPVDAAPAPAERAETPSGVPEVPAAPSAAEAPPARAPASAAAATGAAKVVVVTDVVRAVIDTQGGDLRALDLLAHPVSVDQPDQPFPLLHETPADVFVAQSGLIGHGAGYPTHKVRYRAAQTRYTLAGGAEELRVPLTWQAEDGTRYEKVYVFRRGSYAIDVEYLVHNSGASEWRGYAYGQLVRSYVESGGLFALPTYTGAAIYTPDGKYQKVSFEDMAEQPLRVDTTDGWVAMLQHYFVAALLAEPGAQHQFYSDVLPDQRYVIGLKDLTPTTVAPGETGRLVLRLYAGPKEQDRLEQLAPGLELTVDYGMLTIISAPLFWLLSAIHGWVGNWGWAIVILTFLIKLVFYPLSAASYKSMAHMKKLAPKLQSLKERYGDDRQKLNQAMMELYKTEKINPLGGCLPIVVQIPVFIALYWVLLESVEMRHAPFVLWIRDLSSPDPYFVLPILMGLSMYGQQLLNPQPPDPMQRRIFMVMPAAFTVFFLFFPAGLVLYWLVNNLLSILQQWRINKVITGRGG
jgi:YidC/Oxa1 family membrane protein insertase